MASSQQNLEEMYARLTLEEEDEGGMLVGDEEVDNDKQTFLLVGRFLTERNINFVAMQSMMASLWRPKKGVEIHDLGNHRYSFIFYHVLDIQKVVDGGPWSFEQSPLVCHQVKSGENANDVQLNKMDIWVQVYDLPSGMLSKKILQSIGSHVGTFIRTDPANMNGVWKQYVRIRVGLDVEKPIKRRMKVKRENGSWNWVNFKYERLGTFCFECGMLGHSDRDCEVVYANPTKTIERAYGTWLRAPNKVNKIQNLGAKWLRNGNDNSHSRWSSGQRKETTTSHDGEGVTPNFMKTDGILSEIPGVEGTIRITQRNLRDLHDQGDIHTTGKSGLNDIVGGSFESETIVLDTKRKRIELEKNKEQSKGEDFVDNFMVDGSKNGLEAGPGYRARLDQ